MIEFLNEYRVDMQHIASALLALAIWRWGGAPERWLIGIFLATMVAPIYLFPSAATFQSLGTPGALLYLGTDIAAAIGFTLVALKANRNYPLWVAGFQLVAFGAHAMRGVLDVSLIAVVALIVGPSYFELLIIGGGFVRHVLRKKRFGPYRDWRVTPPSPAWAAP